MEALNERYSLKDDKEINISNPIINAGESRLLLIYEASEELHEKGLRGYIIEFLLKRPEIFEMISLINTSILLKITGDVKYKDIMAFKADFEKHITKFENDHDGKVFWLVHKIEMYVDKKDKIGLRVVGKGNLSFDKRFQAFIAKIKASLR